MQPLKHVIDYWYMKQRTQRSLSRIIVLIILIQINWIKMVMVLGTSKAILIESTFNLNWILSSATQRIIKNLNLGSIVCTRDIIMKLSNFRKSRVQSQSRALIKSKSIYDKRVSSMSFLHYLIFAIFVICLKYPKFFKICMIKARFLCMAYIRSEVIF